MSYDTWVRKPLGELSQIRRGSSPRPIVKYMAETGMPWVKIADATESNSRYIEKTNQFIKFEGVPRSVIVEPGELILSNSGTAGLPKFMGIKACIHDGWQVLRDFKDIDKSFLYYELLFIRSKLLHGAYDSSMKNLTLDMVRNFEIDLPPLQEQKAIANILSSLDDKIELNNKINKNLEKLAQTLYKRWFVDFEFPNEDGEPYKSSGGEMVESELGLIPKGWTVLTLEERFAFERGIEPGSKNYISIKTSDSVAFYRVGDLDQKSNVFVDKELIKNKMVTKKDVLVSFDGAIGRVGVGFEGSYSTGLRKVSDKEKHISEAMIYYIMKSDSIQDTMRAHANGTTILHAGSSIPFLKIPFNKAVYKKFDNGISSIFTKVLQLIEENKKLSKLRDELLPKLMNGEIEVPIEE